MISALTGPPLIAVAHGSRDPRSAQVMAAVVADVRAANPGLDVRLAFLDLSLPAVGDVLAAVAAEGHREAVVVPLLLGDAFHSRVDLPGLLAAARRRHPGLALHQSDVLGSGPGLVSALRGRIAEAGGELGDAGLGVLLTAVGSSRPESNDAVRALAARVADGAGWAGVEVSFATASADAMARSMAVLRSGRVRRIVVAPWFLAPGLLLDRVYRHARELDPAVLLGAPLGVGAELRQIIEQRYRETCAAPLAASA